RQSECRTVDRHRSADVSYVVSVGRCRTGSRSRRVEHDRVRTRGRKLLRIDEHATAAAKTAKQLRRIRLQDLERPAGSKRRVAVYADPLTSRAAKRQLVNLPGCGHI